MFGEISGNFARLAAFFNDANNYEDPAKFEEVQAKRKETYEGFANQAQFVPSPLTNEKDFLAFEEGLGNENFQVPFYIYMPLLVVMLYPIIPLTSSFLNVIPLFGTLLALFFNLIVALILVSVFFCAIPYLITLFVTWIFILIGAFSENGFAPAAMLAWMPDDEN